MSSFFGKLKSNADGKNANSASPAKGKPDPNATQPTPLERMLENAGPLRNDGSDKFWGVENFGNTCYCNSILQALYYSVPFRENMIAYPQRSTPDSIAKAASLAPARPKYPPKPPPPKPNVVVPQSQQPKPEDKDSPEYKKKQALLAGPVLNMSYQNSTAYDMPESLYSAVKDIFEAVVTSQSRHGIISPSKLVEVLRRDNEMFRGQLHQDAHEFFNLLLNTLLDNIDATEKKRLAAQAEAEKLKGDSDQSDPSAEVKAETATVSFPSLLPISQPQPTKWLRDMFEGTLTSETRCLTCENVSQRDEPFLDLSVDLEQHTSVTSCLRRFSEEEMLCERNKFHCDNCGGLQEAEKRMKIKRLPKVLALHLKRFKYTEDYGRLQKLFHKVVYPFHLRLFNTTDEAYDPDRLYELYAVVVHIGGGPFHGHYVAVIKTQDRGWLLFDDEMVEPVDRNYVKNFFGDRPGMATAYVLFYQETTIEAVQGEQRRENQKGRASQGNPTQATSARELAELHQVRSASPPLSPVENGDFNHLDHALSSPILADGHTERPRSPLAVTSPVLSPLGMPQSRKEKSKMEKEQKAAAKAAEKTAKKEKEKEDKERRVQLQDRLAEVVRQNADQMKMAMEESKRLAKDEADRKKEETVTFDDNTAPAVNGSIPAKDNIFRRSKSLKFGSLGWKDKKVLEPEEGRLVTSEPVNAPSTSAIDDTTDSGKEIKEKDKKNRFSLRKKSFGLLSS